MKFLGSFIMLALSLIVLFFLVGLLYSKKRLKNQISKIFGACLLCMFIWVVSLMLQILFQNTSIDPVLFEGFASFGACFIPVFLVLLGMSFSNTKIHFNWKYLLLFVVPTLTTFLMFTNSYHHLFYISYSTNLNECITGPYAIIHTLYSYALIGFSLFLLLQYTIKNSGFFSKQSVLIFLGTSIPVIVNILRNLQNNQHVFLYYTDFFYNGFIFFCFCNI